MDLDPLPLATAFGLLIALLGMWRSEKALSRSKGNELHLLQQTVLLKTEAARTELNVLGLELTTVIHRLELSSGLRPDVRTLVFDFLQKLKKENDRFKTQTADLADHYLANANSLSEDECRKRLRYLEVIIERIKRRQGVSERRFGELMEMVAH